MSEKRVRAGRARVAAVMLAFVLVAAGLADGRRGVAADDIEALASPPPAATFRLQPSKSSTGAGEPFYNPFGEAWTSKLAPNPDIPVALTPGCYRRGPKLNENRPTAAEVTYLANSNSRIIFEECAVLPDREPRLRNFGAALRARDPNVKYIGYFTFGMGRPPRPDTRDYVQAGFAEIERNHADWIVHISGRPLTVENRVFFGMESVLDITNAGYRRFIAGTVARSMAEHGIDGFLADRVGLVPHVNDLGQVPEAVKNGWSAGWQELFYEVRQAVGPDKLIFVNNFRNPPFSRGILRYVDGLMLEDPIGPVRLETTRRSARYRQLNTIFDIAEEANKYILVVVNTNVNGTTFRTTSLAREQAFARFYLAAYLNLFRGERTPLLYYTPTPSSPHFDSEANFADWNLRIGRPVGLSEEVAPAVHRRRFERAYAYWNTSNDRHEIVFGECCAMVSLDGVRVARYTLPPKSGMLFVHPTVLEEGNPSFEHTTNWKPIQRPWGEHERGTAHSGGRSLKIPSRLSGELGLRQSYRFRPNTIYEWSAWVKTRDNEVTTVPAVLAPPGTTTDHQQETRGGGVYVFDDLLPLGNQDWTQVRMTFTTAEGGSGFLYAGIHGQSRGRVWFDDVTLRPIGPSTPPTPTNADLALSATHGGAFASGHQGVFTLRVTNNGPVAAAGPIVVTASLPAGLAFVSGSDSGWACSAAGADVTCSAAGGLSVGDSSTVALTVAVDEAAAPATVLTARVSGPTPDLDDSNNRAADRVRVLRPRAIAGPTSLPAAVVGAAYSQTLRADGGALAYTWSIESGALPAGLSLRPTTGAIAGRPTSEGTASFTVRATDSAGASVTRGFTLTVVRRPST